MVSFVLNDLGQFIRNSTAILVMFLLNNLTCRALKKFFLMVGKGLEVPVTIQIVVFVFICHCSPHITFDPPCDHLI